MSTSTKKQITTSVECSTEVESPQSVEPQDCGAWPPAIPPSHGRGWPQVCAPGSIAHVMGGDLENSLTPPLQPPTPRATSHEKECGTPTNVLSPVSVIDEINCFLGSDGKVKLIRNNTLRITIKSKEGYERELDIGLTVTGGSSTGPGYKIINDLEG